jgi:hypothetical protein
MRPKKEITFLDSADNRIKIRRYFYLALCVLLIVEFFITKHGHFPWETAPAFFAVYGFIACVGLIFIAKVLRLLVKRKEDYYD